MATRERKGDKSELLPFQQSWLTYDGRPLPRCTNLHEILHFYQPFWRLCDGRPPVHIDRRISMPPWELWELYGDPNRKPYGYEKWPKEHQAGYITQAAAIASIGSRLGLDPAARTAIKIQDKKPKGKFGAFTQIKGGKV